MKLFTSERYQKIISKEISEEEHLHRNARRSSLKGDIRRRESPKGCQKINSNIRILT